MFHERPSIHLAAPISMPAHVTVNDSVKGVQSDGFMVKIILYDVDYIYSKVLTTHVCFYEPHLKYIILPLHVYEYRPCRSAYNVGKIFESKH